MFVIICPSGARKLFYHVDGTWDTIGNYGGIHFFSKKSLAYEVFDKIPVRSTLMKVEEFVMVVD
jgi:hypothetical protein